MASTNLSRWSALSLLFSSALSLAAGCSSPSPPTGDGDAAPEAGRPEAGRDLAVGGEGPPAGEDARLEARVDLSTSRCGDGQRQPDEACDGVDLGGKSCLDLGLGAGTLSCTTACTFETLGCGLVAHYAFETVNGAVLDSSGAGNHATNHGAVRGVPGKIGMAFQFDGSAAYVDAGNPTSLQTGSFSASAWVFYTGALPVVSALRTIVTKSQKGVDGYVAGVTGNQIGVEVSQSGYWTMLSTPGFTGHAWHLTTHTYDQSSGTLTTYLDGQPSGSLSIRVERPATAPLKIGHGYDTLGSWGTAGFIGLIDEVRVYNRALSAAEAKALWQAGGGTPPVCGNGQLEGGEGCDRNDFGGKSCADFGFSGGQLACTPLCTIDTLGCGLVAYYELETTAGPALDSSGAGNHGTPSSVTRGVPGRIGKAFEFDGLKSVVDCGNSTSLQSPTFSVSAWIKFTGTLPVQDAFRTILTKARKGVDGYATGVVGDHVGIEVSQPGYWMMFGTPSLTPGAWHHLVHTYDELGTLSSYLDGQPLSSTSFYMAKPVSTPLKLGHGYDTAGRWGTSGFVGVIDEVRIYNRALAPVEVKALYLTAP